MNNGVIRKAHDLLAQGVPFALATVVRRERPTSGEPGDKAIITADGTFLGWVGGSCAQPTVLQEALKSLADGEPRLVVLTPNLEAQAREGIELYRMTCYSGGTLEIYIEPYLPEAQLLVCGVSPAAEALVKIGKAIGFEVVLIDPAATRETFPEADVILPTIEAGQFKVSRDRRAVVATMGHWDEEAIKGLLPLAPTYLGLVASKKRFQEIASQLEAEGISQETLALIRCPAGLDIAARTMPEVALSIMAEIVAMQRSRVEKQVIGSRAEDVSRPKTVVDPVCHMTIDARTAVHRMDFEGVKYYFCHAHCQQSFAADPRKYLVMGAPA
jgi:xanthine dehydrogenase accessory factor